MCCRNCFSLFYIRISQGFNMLIKDFYDDTKNSFTRPARIKIKVG